MSKLLLASDLLRVVTQSPANAAVLVDIKDDHPSILFAVVAAKFQHQPEPRLLLTIDPAEGTRRDEPAQATPAAAQSDDIPRIAEARQIAAQCWCDEETKHLVMNPRLAEAMAKRIASWMEDAARHARNVEYYRGLVVRCGQAIGAPAFVADDGSTSDVVLCAKVPELVEALFAGAVCGSTSGETTTGNSGPTIVKTVDASAGAEIPGGTPVDPASIPPQPPVDNAHVAPGAEPFTGELPPGPADAAPDLSTPGNPTDTAMGTLGGVTLDQTNQQ